MSRKIVVVGEVSDALDRLAAGGVQVDLVIADPPWGGGDLTVDGRLIEADDPDGDDVWSTFADSWLRRLLPLLRPGAPVAVLIAERLADRLRDRMRAILNRQSITTVVWEREYIVEGERGVDTPLLLVAEATGLGADEYWTSRTCGTHLGVDPGFGRYRTAGIIELEQLIGRHRCWAAKPCALYARIIDRWSPTSGVVLDPFAGCGPTAVAAHDLRREWILVERPSELDVLLSRLRASELEFQIIQ